MSWSKSYVLDGHDLLAFGAAKRVIDLGCGEGRQLKELAERGYVSVGIDREKARLANCNGFDVLQARIESVPLKDECADGVLCRVVMPYTDEAAVVNEIARILKRQKLGRLCCHGSGYYLRYLLHGETWKERFYGLRTLINTWTYATLNLRLPGFLGDTIYQSRSRLAKYYRRSGLAIRQDAPAPTFARLPVFLYHVVEKIGVDG